LFFVNVAVAKSLFHFLSFLSCWWGAVGGGLLAGKRDWRKYERSWRAYERFKRDDLLEGG
jgi:hypothetical protein